MKTSDCREKVVHAVVVVHVVSKSLFNPAELGQPALILLINNSTKMFQAKSSIIFIPPYSPGEHQCEL